MRALRALIITFLLAGCSWQQPSAELLKLTALGPTRVDTGDRIELLGEGFPEGKAATLTFRGSLSRPGRPVAEDVELVVRAEGSSTHRLTAVLTEAAQEQFCGVGDEATNATFRGHVVAAFSPRASGAPPITGVMDGVVIEVVAPPTSIPEHRRRHLAAQSALRSAGISLSDEEPGRLIVGKVQGLAAEAGLLPGDELVELDGVRLTALGDFIPPGDAASIQVVVRRPSVEVPFELRLESEVFRHSSTADVALAWLLITLAAAFAFLAAGPLPTVSSWLGRSLRLRLSNGASGRIRKASWTNLVFTELLRPFVSMPLLLRLLPHVSFVALVGLWSCLAFGGEVFAAGLDSVFVLAAANTAALVAALLAGGRQRGADWSIARGGAGVLRSLGHQVPQLFALLTVLAAGGSLRLADLIADQGVMPNQWLAFRTPGTWLGLGVLMMSLVPTALDNNGDFPAALPGGGGRRSATLPALVAVATLLDCVHLWLMAGVVAAAFLGGWAAPEALAVAGLPGPLLGALVFQVKAWGVVFVVVALRWALHEVHQRDTLALIWRTLTPIAIVAVALSVIWARNAEQEVLRATREWLSGALLVLSVLVCAWVGRYLAFSRRPEVLQGQINPWL